MIKKSTSILLAVLLGNLFVSQAQTLTDGLLGSYTFTGNVNDESGKNNHATLTGATLTSDRFGNANSAYNFNGSSNYVTTPISSITTGKLSLCAWVKTTGPATGGFVGIVCSRVSKDIFNGVTFWNNTNGSYGKCIVGDVSSGNTTVTQTFGNASSIWDNAWHFVTYTYDGTTQRLYIDGTLKTSSIKNINQVVGAPFIIGLDNIVGYSRYFNGGLDDVRIYDRALSDSEVMALKNLTPSACTQNITVTDVLVINLTITAYNPVTYGNTIKVYPNPSSSTLTIDQGDYSKLAGYKIAIKNNLGENVYSKEITQAKEELDLTTWTGTGIYFLYLYDNKGYTIDIRKIVLQ